MRFLIRPFDPADTDTVVDLWREAGLVRPWNDPYRDIERTRTVQPDLFLVAVDDGVVIGSLMAGFDGHRGWLSYLAARAHRRGEGVGRALVETAERLLEARGCPKVMLMVRADNSAVVEFYDRLGYAPDDVRVLGKRLIADDVDG